MKSLQFIKLPVLTWHENPRGHWGEPIIFNMADVKTITKDANYSKVNMRNGDYHIVCLSVDKVAEEIKNQSK